MSYRILRYPLALEEYQEIHVGWPAHVLSVAIGKDGNIDLWAEVADPEDRHEAETLMPIPGHPVPDDVTVPIYIVGTGHPIPEEAGPSLRSSVGFLGTVVMGRSVWHIWTGNKRSEEGTR
jgi:hypothetical protein